MSKCEYLPITSIKTDPGHIRKGSYDVNGLKYTIMDVGLLQPILVRRQGDFYMVIDGERRLRAMKDLSISDLIIGREVIIDAQETEADARFKQVIANIQREDIDPIDLGYAFVMLKERYGYQYNEIAEIVGKTPHYITSKAGLVKRLIPELQEMIARDWETSKCIQDTFSTEVSSGQPVYEMNIKVIEDIARLPDELQKTAYLTIKSKEMETGDALEYLSSKKKRRMDKNDPNTQSGSSAVLSSESLPIMNLYKNVEKLDRDVDELASCLHMADRLNRQELAHKIETTMEKLSALYAKLKTEASSVDQTEQTEDARLTLYKEQKRLRARYS